MRYVIKHDDIVESVIGEKEILILSLETGEYLGMNDIAVDIWNCIKQNMHFNEIVEYISRNYSQGAESISCDIDEFIEELINAKIVESIICGE